MFQHQIRSEGDLVAYLTDCTLATVSSLAMKKSASKSELRRQISIAQTAINKGSYYTVDFSKTRAQDVLSKFGGDVAAWADQYRVKK